MCGELVDVLTVNQSVKCIIAKGNAILIACSGRPRMESSLNFLKYSTGVLFLSQDSSRLSKYCNVKRGL